jgi:hypothetical protein
MTATMTALDHATRMAAIHGAKKFWTIREIAGRHYVEADRIAQCSVDRPRMRIVTDGEAIDRARKVGVVCDDDGRIG